MEPTIAISAVAKLIGLGLKGWSAFESRGFEEKDVAAIQSLLETGAFFGGQRKGTVPPVAAQHLALVARSFGQAIGRHQTFHGKTSVARGLHRLLGKDDRERAEEIELRVKAAALGVRELGNDPAGEVSAVDALTSSPLGTPYYRRLWQAFADPGMTLPGEEPPLAMSPTARRELERYFLLAYLAALETPAGRGVADYLANLRDYRATLVRDALLADLASWGGRHLFGNVPGDRWDEGEPVPFLPLDALYVEPSGKLEGKQGEEATPEPLLGLIERLVSAAEAPRVVVVVADFGSGKSLSARMLARRWAEAMRTGTATVSLDATMPIYVRCAEDFPHEAVDLAATTRRAWKRQADGFGLALSDEDDALVPPDDEQRAVWLLDGLDEVALGDQHGKTLFQKLQGRTTGRHRFVVFSRPGAVPARGDLGERVAVVRVEPFSPPQVQTWLDGWNRFRGPSAPVTAEAIAERGLAEITRTPILLFMVAFTWDELAVTQDPPSLAEIYERFFQQIATGKAAVDRERHGPIAAAAETLRAALIEQGVLGGGATDADAMLWLMGKAAWEAQKLEQRQPPEPLTRHRLDNLLIDGDVKLPASAAHAVEIGLVLALQSDLRAADHTILFGHQSFREFLVGRMWSLELHAIARGSERDWDERSAALLGGRLFADETKTLDFLMQLVNAVPPAGRATSVTSWTATEREALVRWAQAVFEDEQQVFAQPVRPRARGSTRLRDDQRAFLREAALAIGSLTRNSPGLRAPHPQTLRSMLAWFWAVRLDPKIIAPGLKADGADLADVHIANANLERASLVGVDFVRATLTNVRLNGAQLTNADLRAAQLKLCSLDGAALTYAQLGGTRTDFSAFRNAQLTRLIASDTYFYRSDFSGADLWDSNLMSARFDRCNFQHARFDGAIMANALCPNCLYDKHTRWPRDFQPERRGATFVPDPPGSGAPTGEPT